ncbi:ferredoxin [Desulfosporosinus acidiphilus SJ4]|uniref:Ferredoxin n=1 Tax=Desulfosporosinus acidiphilus (strain DSM 22704 / JCM 16185 / SJ4) TaxID=646529 RepID=I4D0G2_DESAJ|nr:ferredoxin [Desulfosporosinus acidiphilus]AFM39286.1 ferredoxin [Desulfosporosinus acidiphilus SJ4]
MYASVSSDCIGCAACESICPQVFRMNGFGIAEAYINPIPQELEKLTKDAANNCPVEAITIE